MKKHSTVLLVAALLSVMWMETKTVQAVDTLYADDYLEMNESIVSSNGDYTLACLNTGTLVMVLQWTGSGESYWIWYSLADGYWFSGVGYHQNQWGTAGSDGQALMQGDGNFVLYDGDFTGVWSTSTYGNDGSRLVVQNDGNLVVYSSTNSPLWSLY